MGSAALARLRADIAAIEAAAPTTPARNFGRHEPQALRFGAEGLDRLFPRGLSGAALHEFSSAGTRDAGSVVGFVTALLTRLPDRGLVVWASQRMLVGETGALFAPGLVGFGIDPGRLLFVRSRRTETVLWTIEEALAAEGLSTVVAELWADPGALDLTASRRIALRSARRGTPALVLRHKSEAAVSAARTRWRIGPLPSREARQPEGCLGAPAWHVEVTRNRDGRCGSVRIAFDPATRRFSDLSPAHDRMLLRTEPGHSVAETRR